MYLHVATGLLGLFVTMSAGVGEAADAAGDAPKMRQDMIEELRADGPHASLGDQAKIFGRLVGSWTVEYTDIAKSGKVSHRTGQLLVGWILDGRAIQDVWIVDPSGSRKDREIYSDIRYFDPKSRTWPATFVDPEHASMAQFTGGAQGEDRIVLETRDLGDGQTRWSFNDIRDDSFEFRDEASNDGGKSWRLQSDYRMKRRSTAPWGDPPR